MNVDLGFLNFLRHQNTINRGSSEFNAGRKAEDILNAAKYDGYEPEGARVYVSNELGLEPEDAARIPEWLLMWVEYSIRERIENKIEEELSDFWQLPKFTVNTGRFARDVAPVVGEWLEHNQPNICPTPLVIDLQPQL